LWLSYTFTQKGKRLKRNLAQSGRRSRSCTSCEKASQSMQ
jgi:hypothetical protein